MLRASGQVLILRREETGLRSERRGETPVEIDPPISELWRFQNSGFATHLLISTETNVTKREMIMSKLTHEFFS